MKHFNINQDILKIIALVSMTIDHAFKILLPDSGFVFVIGTEVIGRMAMPIFSFLLMYHLCKRKIFKKYIKRLAFFGFLTLLLVSPFQPFFNISLLFPLNILLTFLLAVLGIWIIEEITKDKMPELLKVFLYSLVVLIMGLFASIFQYGMNGFCYLLAFYFYFKNPTKTNRILLLILALFLNPPWLSAFMSLITTALLLNVDMSQNHKRLIKHWETFYIYYPLHLLLLCAIGYLWLLN